MPSLRSPLRSFIILLIIAVVFFILYGVGVLNPMVGIAKVILSPVQRGFTVVGDKVGGWFSFIGDISQMDEENNELRQQVDDLMSANAKLREITHENELLRAEIGFQHEYAYETVPAAIVSRSTDPSLRAIEINVGKNKGVEVDMPVIVSAGLLVGRVTEVFETTASVILLVDKQSSINAIVQDTRASGIINGEHGLDLRMDLIPQNEEIQSGQTVVTSGLAGIFPAGLLIGEVGEVQESQNALFKEARITPAVDWDHLEIVFVVTGSR
ncbi:rod shape-determining protein MreC [Patescibacteria group bacterium]